MLITREMLEEAIRDKKPLFRDGDEIDENVLYDLFYAPPKEVCTPKGKKQQVLLISKEERETLCSDLIGFEKSNKPYDVVYYKAICKSCGKTVCLKVTKAAIINRTF